jgi:DNA repair exonuclease SbcCD ATPase subunit
LHIAYKNQNISYWSSLFKHFNELAERTGGTLQGLEPNPSVINSFSEIFIAIHAEHQDISLKQYNEQLKKELVELEKETVSTVGKELTKNERELNELMPRINQIALNYEMLSPELSLDYAKLQQYEFQLKSVQEDLRKNKGALKVQTLGHQLPTEIASNSCPTCHQEIHDSLLPVEIKQVPMRIEDNISFLDAQVKMIEVYIDGQNRTISDKQKKLENYKTLLTELRQHVRDLKKELIQDERLPSVIDIEKRLNLRKKVEFFSKVLTEFDKLLQELKEISRNWQKILSDEKSLPKDYFSVEDRKKLTALQTHFLSYLKKFNYQSKPAEHIKISLENYLPVAQKMEGEQLFYNIKFDSSASDFIRTLWSYFTSLLKTATEFRTNHPMVLLLDEPKQQDMSMENFSTFLTELSFFKEQQVLVFASFENSTESFNSATKDAAYTIHTIESKLIQPLRAIEETL